MTKRNMLLAVIVLVFSVFLQAGGISYEFSYLRSAAGDFSVKKHLGYAEYYYKHGMNNNFIDEIRVLNRIDPGHGFFYQSILKNLTGPAGAVIEIAKKENYSKEENELLKAAANDYRESRIKPAVEKLEQILKINPDNNAAKMAIRAIDEEKFEKSDDELFRSEAEKLYGAGIKYYRKGMYQRANELFKEAFETDPMNASVRRMVKLSAHTASSTGAESADSFREKAENAERADEIEKARKSFADAAVMGDKKAKAKLAEYNGKSEELAKEAERLLKQGKVKEAYMKNLEALQYNPDNKTANAVKNNMKRYISDDEAAALVSEVAKKSLEDGDVDKARVLYRKAAAMGDENAKAQVERLNDRSAKLSSDAAALMKKGDTKKAYLEAVKALELDPDNKSARELFETIKKTMPQSAAVDLIYNQGVDYYLKKDYHRALDSWHNVLEISPGDSQTKNNISRAEKKLAAQKKQDRKNAEKAYDEGKKLMSQGLMERAINKFEYVLRLMPEDTAADIKLEEAKKELDVTYDKDAVIKR